MRTICELLFFHQKSRILHIYYSEFLVFNEKSIVTVISQKNIKNIETFHYDPLTPYVGQQKIKTRLDWVD